MNRSKHPIVAKLLIWLAGEILLGLLGLDTLADYTEFLSAHTHDPVPMVYVQIG